MSEELNQLCLNRIDFKKYIDEIQAEIGITVKEVGIGSTEDEKEKGRDRLQAKLKILSQRLASELGLVGDYNIIFMLTLSMITTAWATFILKAKSLDQRRPAPERSVMGKMVECMSNSFKEIIAQAISYGEIYDKIKR